MGVVIVEGEKAVLGVNLGRPIVTNGAFATHSSQITLRTCCIWKSLFVSFIPLNCFTTYAVLQNPKFENNSQN